MRPVLFVLSTVGVLALVGCGGDGGPTDGDGGGGPAASIAKVSGDEQRIATGRVLLAPLTVKVSDSDGNGVAGVVVSWAVVAGGGTLSAASSTTGSEGRASVTLTAGSAPGVSSITATAAELSGSPVTFTAEAVEAAGIAVSAGDGQSARISQPLAQALEVRVTAGDGGPVPGAPVRWAVSAGGGSLSASSSTADSDGRASAGLTLGSAPGTNSVTATVDGLPGASASFDATGSTPVRVTIDMSGIAFVVPPGSRPSGGGSDDAQILLGDTITWVNLDAVQHTATSTSAPAGGASFDSGLRSQNDTFTFVPNTRGTWVYFCEVHPVQMRGARIVVQ